MSELAYLRTAIRAAKQAGLFREFSCQYRHYRCRRVKVCKAAWMALYDWDLLDDIVMVEGGALLRLKAGTKEGGG